MNSLWWSLWWLLSPFIGIERSGQHEGYVCSRRACGLGEWSSVKSTPYCPVLYQSSSSRTKEYQNRKGYESCITFCLIQPCVPGAWNVASMKALVEWKHEWITQFTQHNLGSEITWRTTEGNGNNKAILLQAYYVIGTVVRALRYFLHSLNKVRKGTNTLLFPFYIKGNWDKEIKYLVYLFI